MGLSRYRQYHFRHLLPPLFQFLGLFKVLDGTGRAELDTCRVAAAQIALYDLAVHCGYCVVRTQDSTEPAPDASVLIPHYNAVFYAVSVLVAIL